MKRLKIMFEAIKKWFGHRKDENLDMMIEMENLHSFSIATLTVAIVDLLFLFGTLWFAFDNTLLLWHCLGVFLCSAACFITSGLLRLYCEKHKSNKPKGKSTSFLIVLIIYIFMSAMSIAVDFYHYKSGEQMLFFYIVQVCFLLFFNMRPVRCLITYAISFGLLCGNVIVYDGGKNFNFTSFGIFFALAVVGNAVKYNSRVARYLDYKALKLKEQENNAVIEHSGKFVQLFDLKANILHNGQKVMQMFGLPEQVYDPANTLTEQQFVMPESYNDIKSFYGDMRNAIAGKSINLKLKTADGSVVWHHGDYTLLKDEYGKYDRSIISFSDVTEQMERQLLHEQRIHEIVSLTRNCDFYIEGSIDRWVVEKYTAMNDKAKDIPYADGCDVDDILNNKWKYLVYEADYPRVKEFFNKSRLKNLYANGTFTEKIEFRLVSKKAEWYSIELCMLRAESGNELNFFALFRDTSDFHSQYDKLVIKATKDDLTGLYNRETTMRMIEEFLSGEGASGTHALIMLDMDDFKMLNDTLGHQTGDEALKNIGECLRYTFRQTDICGRIGGDEFFAFLKNVSIEVVIRKVKKILSEMQMTFANEKTSITTSLSIGIAMYHGEGIETNTLKTLYAKVDAALYKSKALGKNTFTFADELDAIAASSASDVFLKNEAIAYNLRVLFENLANGIAIFQGDPDDGLVPVFCNDRLLTLLEITYEGFFVHMSRENNYGLHPDDVERAERSLKQSRENGLPARDTVRFRKGTGEYCYVTVFSNLHMLENGNAEWYVIYSEAKEAEQLRRMNEERYSRFSTGYTAESEHSDAYMVLNITKNKCCDSYSAKKKYYPINTTGTVDDFFDGLASNIAYADIREKFRADFSLEQYKKYVDDGIYRKEIKIPCLLASNEIYWFKFVSEVAINPATGDIEAFALLDDINNEVRLGSVVERMLANEYEMVAQLDVQNGYITQFGNASNQTVIKGDSYRDEYRNAIESVLSPEYLTEGIEALSFEKILNQLERNASYSRTFPVILDGGKTEKTWQWRFEYSDELHNTILLTVSDISKKTEYGYDALTGMLGRRGFDKAMKAKLGDNSEYKYRLMEVDFDNFNLINEKLGFSEGDRLIRKFSADLRRKEEQFGKDCLMGHLEGDHFIILVRADENMISPEEINREIADLVESYLTEYKLKPRMGVYEVTDISIGTTIMYDCAHMALKASKTRSDKSIVYYSDDIKDKILEGQLLSAEFQNAVETGQFEVWFQPQVNHANDGVLIGAEALVRWNHPVKGMISPAVFVPIFEGNGLIYELDKYVWRRTCRHIRKWLDDGTVTVPISVNISRQDILNDDFLETIESIVEEYRVPLELIHFEITESAFSENVGVALEKIKKLIGRGFFVSIDDFGSGYSSLSMVKDVPVQMLKLDMRFFAGAGSATRNKCVIESVIRMAKLLGMSVIAEGVEHVNQADFLVSAGCRYIQGFLYSKPLPYSEFLKYAEENADNGQNATQISPTANMQVDNAKTQELFRSIIARTNDVIIVSDINTKQLLYANSEAERYYGKAFDPIETTTCSAFCNHSFCDNCPAQDLKQGEQKQIMLYENGRHMLAHFARIEWNGHDAHVLYQTDITNEMRESERANSLIRNIPAALIVLEFNDNEKPKVTYISDQTLKLLNQDKTSKDNLSLDDCLSRIHPDDVDRVRIAAEGSALKKEEFNEKFRLKRKDGSYIWVELTVNPVADQSGKYQFYGIYKDISERKNSQEKTDSLIQSIPAAIAIYAIDQEDRMNRVFISDITRKMLDITGDSHEVVGMEVVYSAVHPDDRERIRSISMDCIKKRKPFCLQFRVVRKDGTFRWIQIDSTPIMRDENTCYFYSIYTNIDAEKRMTLDRSERQSILNTQKLINKGLRKALSMNTPDESISYILEYVGKTVCGERAYVFEKNPDGTDSNTFEWVAEGISAEKDNLQNVTAEVTLPWYEHFSEHGAIIIADIEDIKEKEPALYEVLAPQNIHSLIVAPFFGERGKPAGFFGIDNPPPEVLDNNVIIAQTVAYFIEAEIKRRNLTDI